MAGLCVTRADDGGGVRLYLPEKNYYAIHVRYRDHERILYVEWAQPGARYTYRPGEAHLLPAHGRT